jgi:hypothetical protein
MSLLLAAALAAIQPTCSWDSPGANRYTGSVESAIDGYAGLPEQVRATLKRRIAENQPDDTVEITRDAIRGKRQYDPAIRDMHFGSASVCGTVTRARWTASHVEPAAVYCVDQHCILVPKVCGNISRIERVAPPAVAAAPFPAPSVAPRRPTLYDLEQVARRKELGLIDAPGHELEDIERDGLIADTPLIPGGGPAAPDGYVPGPGNLTGGPGHPLGGRPPIDGDGGGPIAPVPEADTWAMLLGGLALLGAVSARRRARGARKS